MKLPSPHVVCVALVLSSGCGGSDEPRPPPQSEWQLVHGSLPAALFSVWGTSESDVWMVGADANDGAGATVFHFDGATWSQLETGHAGDLWWVFGFAGGGVYMGGTGGTILHYQEGEFTPMTTPGGGVVFGIWGSSESDLWAVGGSEGGSEGAFAWRNTGEGWIEAPGFPAPLAATDALWKVFGRGPDDVWMVGTLGKTLHFDGATLVQSFVGVSESLFTVHANGERFAAVGGFGTGLLIEHPASQVGSGAWQDMSPRDAPSLIGVCLTDTGGYAVGEFGYVARRDESGWHTSETGFEVDVGSRSLHSVWVDPSGAAWTVGGQIRVAPLVDGVILHSGDPVSLDGLPGEKQAITDG